MKKFLLAVVLLCFTIISGSFAQSKDETAVATAVEQLRKAMVDADKSTLEKLADEGLSYGHSLGKVENKKEFVENILNKTSDFVKIELSEQTIYISGNTAIVRHKFTADTHDKGKDPGKVSLSVLTVWQKKSSDWPGNIATALTRPVVDT